MSALLNARQRIKKKRNFKREYHRIKIDDDSWRKPKGIHSKNRKGFKSHGPRVRVGFGSPSEIRGRTFDGLLPIRVHNTSSEKLGEKEALIISGKVGAKKRAEIIAKADKLKIKVINKPAFLERKLEQRNKEVQKK